MNAGPLGVTGSNSANTLAAEADGILAVGTRLQDFTTGSRAAFARDSRIIGLNVGRHDAAKHMSLPLICDAKAGLAGLEVALAAYRAPRSWTAHAKTQRAAWNDYVALNITPGNGTPTYAQAIGAVNALCTPLDRIVAAAGGLPAEVTANWRSLGIGPVDVGFGFSCMVYEIAGGWGARIAQAQIEPDGATVVFAGDGSYLLMNTDIYSSVLSGHKLIVLVRDNGGFAVINKLQRDTGNASFNTLLADCPTIAAPFGVDFATHARAMGALAEEVTSVPALAEAFQRAKEADRTSVIVMKVDPHDGWTERGHAWWGIGTAEVSNRPKISAARVGIEAGRSNQRAGT